MKARIALALATLVLPTMPVTPVHAAVVPRDSTAPGAAHAMARANTVPDTRELTRTRFTLDGKTLPPPRYVPSRTRRAAGQTPPVGTVRPWLGLDDTAGRFYREDYTLRGVGQHIEVWVANDTAFPTGDCRRDGVTVTDAQVAALIHEFDANIYPKETTAFSTPPDRDGTNSPLPGDFTGAGDRTVTLVDNVRDNNYFHFPADPTYIAGFFSAQLNELFDRNVMTIDAYDWVHRTGAAPPDNPTDDLCTSRPARPRLYEATFAHEWQHLLEYYADPAEAIWVNEGLSDYAQTLTGYVDATKSVYQRGFDSHLACFQGFGTVRTPFNTNPRACGGPQNSLNLWDEGTPTDVLADYGNAYQFMLYLHDRYGPAVLTRLHRDRADHGLAGVTAALPAGVRLYDVLHDYQVATLVDKISDRAASLRSTVNLVNPTAYDTPGAAPNGADYVRLRDAAGRYLTGRDLRSVTFTGAKTLPPLKLSWTSAGGALSSGNDNNMDAGAVIAVTVPAVGPTLRFSSSYAVEAGYDFGYVTVSEDGGHTYTVVGGDRTIPGPLGPGLTGSSGEAFVPLTYDLSGYAGKKILLGFRYVTDGSINQGGWSIKDITIGGQPVSSNAEDYRSPTQIVPTPVYGMHVTLVGMSATRVREVRPAQWRKLRDFDKIVAIVAYDEPTEKISQYAPYALTVNGVRQPG